ncbi:MAG: site-specific integrase [Thermomicrobiales bacterium]|nr:site-specific integrase [Thermomicrobiales bacterium]
MNYFAPDAHGVEVRCSKSFSARAYGGARKAETAAKAFLAEHVTKVRDGSFVAPSSETVRDLIDRWLRTKRGDLKHGSILNYEQALAHLPPSLATMRAQDARPAQFHDLYNELKEQGLTATVKQLHTIINAAYGLATRLGLVLANPVAHVRPNVTRRREIIYWTPEETARFLVAAEGDPFAAAWWLLALTGMRVGECFALTWEDIDLTRGTVAITKTITRDPKGKWIVGATPKTQNSRRTIPLPPSCLDPLRRHRSEQAARRLASPVWDTTSGNLVFERGAGELTGQRVYTPRFAAIVARTGLRRITPHGLRHSFATAMLLANVHPSVVAEILGDTVTTVLSVYSHVTEGSKSGAITHHDDAIAGLVRRLATG